MPQVFLSYARRDLPTLQPLLQELRASGITIWRDQDSLYGGQQWPKAIGEAIAAHDALLLAWSHAAAASHFVELEWNTALALQKSILLCLLDQTPLPPALRAINGIDARLPREALPKILHALEQPVTPQPVSLARSWLDKWQTWVIFLAALLSLITIALDLPTRIRETFTNTSTTTEVLQTLAGMITDERQEPLAEVEVFVPEFNRTASTDRHGVFTFQIRAIPQRPVRLVARKEGYRTYPAEATLGNPSFNFIMQKEK